MPKVIENTAGKTRNKPIQAQLKAVLIAAAKAAGVDTISVTSGGQDKKGEGTRRTGSTRHDGGAAADLQLLRKGQVLDFNLDREVFKTFVTAAAAAGATGLGAGEAYMGPKTIHVGFGSKLVWGSEGKAINAPAWLKHAAELGWSGKAPKPQPVVKATLGRNQVIARGGLRLRGGPGTEFTSVQTLEFGSELMIVAFDEVDPRWALADLEADGRIDGYVFSPMIAPTSDAQDGD